MSSGSALRCNQAARARPRSAAVVVVAMSSSSRSFLGVANRVRVRTLE